jgi:catechol 2,3-dioxygenase-like lactoylglutathione lyase family enzyme
VKATHLFAGLPVSDYDAARGWYERLLGRVPDRLPKLGEAVWQLTDTSLIYVVEDPARAGSGLLTIALDGLEEQLANLADRGIPVRSELLANGLRKATVQDPDGNAISFFEAPLSDEPAD